MWDCVTYVEPLRSPIIYEGASAARVLVSNAGPGVVDLVVWLKSAPPTPALPDPPDIKMRLPPGDTRAVAGSMVGIRLSDDQKGAMPGSGVFATIAWRVVQ